MGRSRGSGAGGRGSAGQQSIAAILTAAGELASLYGLERLSMAVLASAVGMSKGGLYAHFDSKEELQVATIEHVSAVFAEKVLHGSLDDSAAGLDALLERWLSFFEQKVFPGGCFLISAAVEFANRPGPVHDALEAALDGEIGALETTIRRANKTGELNPEKDARQTAFELHSILMNTHALFQVKDNPAVFNQARAAIHKLLA
ncbi:MAG: TetR/AcrR family transcriptional regulator [Thermoleophilaceae bacterium]